MRESYEENYVKNMKNDVENMKRIKAVELEIISCSPSVIFMKKYIYVEFEEICRK